MYKRILVVVESDATDSAAVAHGIALAHDHSAELVFLAIVPELGMPLVDYPMVGLDDYDALSRAAGLKSQDDLQAARRMAEQAGVRSRAVKVVAPVIASSVIDRVRQDDCDLVVIESQGRNSVMRLLAGSLIPGLITLSSVPVLVVRHGCAGLGDAVPTKPREAADPKAAWQ